MYLPIHVWARCHTTVTTKPHGIGEVYHYDDVIMEAIASQITSLTIVYSPFIQTQIKENIKAPRTFPAQMTSNAENVSIWWRSSCVYTYAGRCRYYTANFLLIPHNWRPIARQWRRDMGVFKCLNFDWYPAAVTTVLYGIAYGIEQFQRNKESMNMFVLI